MDDEVRCRVCGIMTDMAGRICGECRDLGFQIGTEGEVICPTCGEDFKECGCSAPDSAWM